MIVDATFLGMDGGRHALDTLRQKLGRSVCHRVNCLDATGEGIIATALSSSRQERRKANFRQKQTVVASAFITLPPDESRDRNGAAARLSPDGDHQLTCRAATADSSMPQV
jgi:hypothetical protein